MNSIKIKYLPNDEFMISFSCCASLEITSHLFASSLLMIVITNTITTTTSAIRQHHQQPNHHWAQYNNRPQNRIQRTKMQSSLEPSRIRRRRSHDKCNEQVHCAQGRPLATQTHHKAYKSAQRRQQQQQEGRDGKAAAASTLGIEFVDVFAHCEHRHWCTWFHSRRWCDFLWAN